MIFRMKAMRFGCRFASLFALAVTLCAQENSFSQLVVNDPRPVANAAARLESLYGLVITYEDPQWVVPSETKDVTDSVRRDTADVSPAARASVPRVLVPRGGRFAFSAPEAAPSGRAELLVLVQKMVTASSLAGNPGAFRVFDSGGDLHIVPSGAIDSKKHKVQMPLLEVPIEIPERDWNSMDVLDEICRRLSAAAGQRIVLGTIPINDFAHHRGGHSTSGTARDVLASVLRTVGPAYSWQLLFDPGLNTYVLNVHSVAAH